MGVLFRASLGFAVAWCLVHPQDAASWAQAHFVAPIAAQCPEGLAHCGQSAPQARLLTIAGLPQSLSERADATQPKSKP
jgi:hypothetical protein